MNVHKNELNKVEVVEVDDKINKLPTPLNLYSNENSHIIVGGEFNELEDSQDEIVIKYENISANVDNDELRDTNGENDVEAENPGLLLEQYQNLERSIHSEYIDQLDSAGFYHCDFCSYKSSVRLLLLKHRKYHYSEDKCKELQTKLSHEWQHQDQTQQTNSDECPESQENFLYEISTFEDQNQQWITPIDAEEIIEDSNDGIVYEITTDSLEETNERTTKSRPFKCNLCTYKTVTKKYLDVHLEKHAQNKDVCPYCSKCFKCYSDLQRHLVTHSKKDKKKDSNAVQSELYVLPDSDPLEIPTPPLNFNSDRDDLYLCVHCKERFPNKEETWDHVMQNHRAEYESEKAKFEELHPKCHFCEKRFNFVRTLKRHILKEHPTEDVRFLDEKEKEEEQNMTDNSADVVLVLDDDDEDDEIERPVKIRKQSIFKCPTCAYQTYEFNSILAHFKHHKDRIYCRICILEFPSLKEKFQHNNLYHN